MLIDLPDSLGAQEGSISIIGGADGPTAIFVTTSVSPLLIACAALAVVAAIVIAVVVIRKRRGNNNKKQ